MSTSNHPVVSREAWIEARKNHLAEEKVLTRALDALYEKRRQLPWVKVDQSYSFDGPDGSQTLSDLFQGRSQLIIHHLMFTPEDEQACVGCSFQADHIDCCLQHLRHHDVMVTAVSRAPWRKLQPFKERMSWQFPWVSSHGTEFNRDYGVTFTPEQVSSGNVGYNYGTASYAFAELPGVSVFFKDTDGTIYHTYSTYARGLDILINTHHYLDMTPKGRNEATGPDPAHGWLRYHDQYETKTKKTSCTCE